MEKIKENQKISVLFMLFGTLFCVCLITANVLETKQISFGPANMTWFVRCGDTVAPDCSSGLALP